MVEQIRHKVKFDPVLFASCELERQIRHLVNCVDGDKVEAFKTPRKLYQSVWKEECRKEKSIMTFKEVENVL